MQVRLTREQRVVDRFLRTYEMVDARLETSLAGLERAESARSSITCSMDGMGLSGGQHDKLATALFAMDEAVLGIAEHASQFKAAFIEIEDFVSEVQRRDNQAGKVLRYLYLDLLNIREAAKRLDYSSRNVYVLLKKGLDIGYDILAEEGGYGQ